jgi:hypothetical protein
MCVNKIRGLKYRQNGYGEKIEGIIFMGEKNTKETKSWQNIH